MNDKNNDNVIQFPGPKKDKEKETTQTKPTLFFDFENRKVMISASLGSILLLAAMINISINSMTESEMYALKKLELGYQAGRMIACDESDKACRDRAEQRKDEVKRQIASVTPDETIIYGRRPNALEDLRFGQLAGNYALNYTHEQSKGQKFVRSIEFVPSADSIPTYLNDREAFLWKNAKHLPVQFDTVAKAPVLKKGDNTVERYHLVQGEEKMGTAKFIIDQFGRFISLEVEE